MRRVRSVQRVWLIDVFLFFCFSCFNNNKTEQTQIKTYGSQIGSLQSNTGAEEICRPTPAHLIESLANLTRRAVVSRVIRVQRRYSVQIRPIRSMGLANFGRIFELLIDLYRICIHFSHIEHVLRIHLVKISLIFIQYELSTEQSNNLVCVFLIQTW